MKKIVLSLFAAISLTGCINTIKHVPLKQRNEPYEPTCFVACDAVGIWWNKDYQKKYPIEASWMKLTWLVWIVDLPFEAVMDTVWLPYDIYNTSRQNKAIEELNRRKGTRFGNAIQSPYNLNCNYYIRTDDL